MKLICFPVLAALITACSTPAESKPETKVAGTLPEPTVIVVTVDLDADNDGYQTAVDCNDSNDAVHPGATEVAYDGIDNDCDPHTLDDDLDRDGSPFAADCDDGDPERHPLAQEVPYDAIDNDCDPSTLDDDLDGDGRLAATDCDDLDPGAWQNGALHDRDLVWTEAPTFCEGYCERTVTQDVSLAGPGDLSQLACLTEVQGDVTVSDHPDLVSLAGLDKLRRVDGQLSLRRNSALQSLDGLGNLVHLAQDEVDYSLIVEGNPQLLSLDALSDDLLLHVGVAVGDNDMLTSLHGLHMAALQSQLLIYGNDQLVDLDGLQGIAEVHGGLEIFGNERVSSLAALSGLGRVDGMVLLEGNPSLHSLHGLDQVTTISTFILHQSALADLHGLDQLLSVGTLDLDNNDDLTSLEGLDALQRVDWLLLVDNDALEDVSALDGVQVGEELRIEGNHALTTQAIDTLSAAVDPSGTVTIVP